MYRDCGVENLWKYVGPLVLEGTLGPTPDTQVLFCFLRSLPNKEFLYKDIAIQHIGVQFRKEKILY